MRLVGIGDKAATHAPPLRRIQRVETRRHSKGRNPGPIHTARRVRIAELAVGDSWPVILRWMIRRRLPNERVQMTKDA